MKTFKSVIAATLVSTFVLSSLASCSSDAGKRDESETETTTTTEATTTTEETTTRATTEATTTSSETSEESTVTTSSSGNTNRDIVLCGLNITFTAEIATEDIEPDYVDSNDPNAPIVIITPSESVGVVTYTSVNTYPDGEGWYLLESIDQELITFNMIDKDDPIAIQMDLNSDNPIRAIQYIDGTEYRNLAFIQYDPDTNQVIIEENHAVG